MSKYGIIGHFVKGKKKAVSMKLGEGSKWKTGRGLGRRDWKVGPHRFGFQGKPCATLHLPPLVRLLP